MLTILRFILVDHVIRCRALICAPSSGGTHNVVKLQRNTGCNSSLIKWERGDLNQPHKEGICKKDNCIDLLYCVTGAVTVHVVFICGSG